MAKFSSEKTCLVRSKTVWTVLNQFGPVQKLFGPIKGQGIRQSREMNFFTNIDSFYFYSQLFTYSGGTTQGINLSGPISPNTLSLLTNSKITAISSSGSIVNTSNLRFVSIHINLNCFLKFTLGFTTIFLNVQRFQLKIP